VKPRVVVEINADEITRSPIHVAGSEKTKDSETEGLALRFPRLVRVRNDKSADEATTERELVKLFEMQRKSRGQSSE
jgi:DNA ligase-1